MSCISKTDIQQYIDNECSMIEKTKIEQHLNTCSSCRELLAIHKQQSMLVKESMKRLSVDSIDIPDFIPTQTVRKKPTLRLIIYSVSAACLILFVLMLNNKKSIHSQEQLTVTSTIEFDSNKPITEQPMVVNFIDADGNQTEYYLN